MKLGREGEGKTQLACPVLVAYVEPKIVFLEFLAGNSPVQPLVIYLVDVDAWQSKVKTRGRMSLMQHTSVLQVMSFRAEHCKNRAVIRELVVCHS